MCTCRNSLCRRNIPCQASRVCHGHGQFSFLRTARLNLCLERERRTNSIVSRHAHERCLQNKGTFLACHASAWDQAYGDLFVHRMLRILSFEIVSCQFQSIGSNSSSAPCAYNCKSPKSNPSGNKICDMLQSRWKASPGPLDVSILCVLG